jgi:hypothetical protein
MLGRKTYTEAELENARASVEAQLAAYEKVSASAAATALDEFTPLYFNSLVLVLDRLFVHRLRTATGKDANALNEVELLAESLMNNGGEMRVGTVVRWVPEQTVLGLRPGDRISVNEEEFRKLSAAFLSEIETRFVTAPAA